MLDEQTCSGRQVEDKYSQHAGEDAGHDDVDDVEQRLPLDDEVEGDVLVQVFLHVFPRRLVTDGPLAVFCRQAIKPVVGFAEQGCSLLYVYFLA